VPVDVARPDVRGQAVAAVVGDAQGLVHVLERDRAYHRPEDLLLEDLHRRVCVREYGWFDEVALVSAALAPGDQLRALRHARFAVGRTRSCCFLETSGPSIVLASRPLPSGKALATTGDRVDDLVVDPTVRSAGGSQRSKSARN